MKKIAVDAMGGDHAPKAIVEGVNQALAAFPDIEVQLYGDEAKIKEYLTETERVSIIHTDEKINSDDEPAKAIRKKKDASMVLAARAVKEGQADAVLSAGNTGALMAAGLFVVVVVLLPVKVDENFAPFVRNLDLDGLACELVLNFHLLGSFHGSQAELQYGKNRPRNKKSRMTAKLSFRGHPAIW